MIGKSVLLLALGWLLGAWLLPELRLRLWGVRCDAGDEAAWINDLEMELTK